MKILFWVPYPTEGASNRYRVEQYLPFLNKEGINYYVHHFWNQAAYKILYKKGKIILKTYFLLRGTLSRLLDLACIFYFDIVFIHREAYPLGGEFFEKILFKLKKPYIYDFDDSIYLLSSSSTNKFITNFKKPHKINKIIKMASCVVAGNKHLADFSMCHNKSTYILPTPIDTEKYFPFPKVNSGEIVIGWIGSGTTSQFLDLIKEPFISLSKKFNNIRLVIIGGSFSIKGHTNIINIPWSMSDEIACLRMFDIGIMPMPENDWTKGKCGFKAILYMSMGIPCVCSPVGVNKEIINDNENGYLAGSGEEWISKLSKLIADLELRIKIGTAGRRTIEKKYSVNVNAPKFIDIIKRSYSQNNRDLSSVKF